MGHSQDSANNAVLQVSGDALYSGENGCLEQWPVTKGLTACNASFQLPNISNEVCLSTMFALLDKNREQYFCAGSLRERRK
jgi:hypothetical protein